MTFLDPRTGQQVEIINLSEERKKRSEALAKLAQQDAFLLPGDETDYKPFKGPPGTVDGTRDNC